MDEPRQYRGIHNGGWKFGYLSYDFKRNEHLIINSQGTWPVISATVGQQVGKQDVLGKEIYEGDRARRYGGVVIIVGYSNGNCTIDDGRLYEIIGNIHEEKKE